MSDPNLDDRPDRPPSTFDYEALASGLDALRETLRAMVAAVVADGFTDREARQIITGVFTNLGRDDSEGDD